MSDTPCALCETRATFLLVADEDTDREEVDEACTRHVSPELRMLLETHREVTVRKADR